jgi:hypothetical protein
MGMPLQRLSVVRFGGSFVKDSVENKTDCWFQNERKG